METDSNASLNDTTQENKSILDGLDALFDAAETMDFNPHNSVSTMRKNAIALGALGFEVFPIHYMKERPFSGGVWECSCLDLERWFAKKENDPDREIKCHNKPAKHPAIKWKEAATSDADEIKDLWSIRRFQGANIAIATGERSGVYVIDLDGQVGMDSIRALEAIHGELPKTMMAFSGRGDGLHLFFKAPADAAGLTISAGTIGAGIDTRGNGGYVVGPGSNHASMRRYMWVPGYGPGEAEIAELPEWFIEAMKAASLQTAEEKAAAKAAKGEKAPKESKSSADPFDYDAFALAGDEMLSGGWTVQDEVLLTGLDAHLANIGEEDEGFEGFHTPIYSALLSFFHHNGLEATDEEAKAALVPTILAASCKDGRNKARYATDRYLDERIKDARENFEKKNKEAKEKVTAATDQVDEIMAKITATTSAKEFQNIYKLMGSVDMPPVKRTDTVKKLMKLTGLTASVINGYIDGFAAEFKLAAAKKYKKEAAKNKSAAIATGNVKPSITYATSDFDLVVDHCKEALIAKNKGAAMRLFNVGDKKVRLLPPDITGKQITQPMDQDTIWSELNEAVRWLREVKDTQLVTSAPTDVAKQLFEGYGWCFPQLTAITASPVFDADGDLISTPGYHAKSGIFYAPPKGFVLPPIPDKITRDEMLKARHDIMYEVLRDFPFSDAKVNDKGDASRAHAMALLLLQFMMAMLKDCNRPIFFGPKPEAGSGMTLLIQMLLYIPHGRIMPAMTQPKDDDEMRKQLTTSGVERSPVVWIDNVKHHLHGAALCNWITCRSWEGRILGHTKNAVFEQTSTTIISGNNPNCDDEIKRRSIAMFLDAGRDPKERSGFRRDLERYVPDNRAKLVAACLTMIRYWVQQGKPMWQGKVLPSFTGFSRIMGGLLECLEIPGFLENRHIMTNAAANDDEDWPELCAVWFDNKKLEKEVTAAEVYCLIVDHGLDIKVSGVDPDDFAKALGIRMAHKVKKVYHAADGRSFRIVSMTQENGKRGTCNKGLWAVRQMVADPYILAAEDMSGGLTEEDFGDLVDLHWRRLLLTQPDSLTDQGWAELVAADADDGKLFLEPFDQEALIAAEVFVKARKES